MGLLDFLTSTTKYEWYDPRGYQLPEINLPQSLDEVQTTLWNNKEWVMGGCAAIAVVLIARKVKAVIAKIPDYPIVKIDTTINVAELSITIPKKITPPNVLLAIAFDKSGSMVTNDQKENREMQAHTGLEEVFKSAAEKVQKVRGANVEAAIVGFNDYARTICEPTKITSSSIAGFSRKLKSSHSNGGTRILNGVTKTLEVLKGMAAQNKGAVPVLMVITDGEEGISEESVLPIHAEIATIRGLIFVIGVGSHNVTTMNALAGRTGKYIDARKTSISAAISEAYSLAISMFNNLKLGCPLEAGTWSVNRTQSSADGKKSGYDLGAMPYGNQKSWAIKIHRKKLKSPLDLSKFHFDLNFTDSIGRTGQMKLPWKPNTLITPPKRK